MRSQSQLRNDKYIMIDSIRFRSSEDLPAETQSQKTQGSFHGVPFVIKTIRITSKVRLYCNKTRSFRPITILITNQTKPLIDLACFDCLHQTEGTLDGLAGNRTRLSSTGSELIEMECQQMKSNENEITDTSQQLFRCSIHDDNQNNRDVKLRLRLHGTG